MCILKAKGIRFFFYFPQAHAGIKGMVYGYQEGSETPMQGASIIVMNITDESHPHLIGHAISTSNLPSFKPLLLYCIK